MLGILILSGLAAGADPAVTQVALPAPPAAVQLTADPGVRIGLSAGGVAAAFSFADEAQADAVLFPIDAAKLDTWSFVGARPGVYHLVCSTGPASGIVHVYVTVGKPPAPKPPGPVPPPPAPKPPAPPDRPLMVRLKTAYQTDAGEQAKKEFDLNELAELYKQAAALVRDKAKVGSIADVRNRVKEAASELKVGLPSLRAAISAEVAAVLPSETQLTDDSRAKLADLFDVLSVTLLFIK